MWLPHAEGLHHTNIHLSFASGVRPERAVTASPYSTVGMHSASWASCVESPLRAASHHHFELNSYSSSKLRLGAPVPPPFPPPPPLPPAPLLTLIAPFSIRVSTALLMWRASLAHSCGPPASE